MAARRVVATFLVGRCLYYVDHMDTRAPEVPNAAAEQYATALYQEHAVSLARLALLMLGDADAAQDVVQDAFFGLYRRRDKLANAGTAPRLSARQRTQRLFLTGNGQAVVCGNSTYSAGAKRWTAVWLPIRSRRRRSPAFLAAFRNRRTCQPSMAVSAWTGRTRLAPRLSAAVTPLS